MLFLGYNMATECILSINHVTKHILQLGKHFAILVSWSTGTKIQLGHRYGLP